MAVAIVSPLACVTENPVSVGLTVPPVLLKLPLTVRLPVPPRVPPDRLRLDRLAVAPLSARVPPCTLAVPAPSTMLLSWVLPVPETVSVPPSEVAPRTLSEPPETLSELLLVMVSAPTLSVP